MCTGWTWEYIDEYMTIPRLDAMGRYWDRNPPLHMMVAAYLGIGNKKEEGDFGELIALFGENGTLTSA